MISPRQRLVLEAGTPFLFIDQAGGASSRHASPGSDGAGRKAANPDFSLWTMAGTEMTPGRTFSLLTGIALLGAVAGFNEMTPGAQASLLPGRDAAAIARCAGSVNE
jgi:hypothetical protein